jgi:hypothetical protein
VCSHSYLQLHPRSHLVRSGQCLAWAWLLPLSSSTVIIALSLRALFVVDCIDSLGIASWAWARVWLTRLMCVYAVTASSCCRQQSASRSLPYKSMVCATKSSDGLCRPQTDSWFHLRENPRTTLVSGQAAISLGKTDQHHALKKKAQPKKHTGCLANEEYCSRIYHCITTLHFLL